MRKSRLFKVRSFQLPLSLCPSHISTWGKRRPTVPKVRICNGAVVARCGWDLNKPLVIMHLDRSVGECGGLSVILGSCSALGVFLALILRSARYSHYDVVAAGNGWTSDPWTMRAEDGYFYGRGVSDNKGAGQSHLPTPL